MRAYTRAYVDRDAATDGPIRFIAATEGRKGDNIDLRMSGARLERFQSNPVFGYGHRYFSRQDLPIGKGEAVSIDGDRLLIDVSFDQGDEFAKEVERKYRGGFLNAVSIGFEVLKWEGGQGSHWSGGVAEEWELHELSAVPVPMDPSAVVSAGRSLLFSEGTGVSKEFDLALLNEIVNDDELALGLAIARAIRLEHPKTPLVVEPEVPVEAPAGVDTDAARSLLAVFDPKENS